MSIYKHYTSGELREANRKFLVQKHGAKRREIEFLFTFEQWFTLWHTSGHYKERGQGRNQYCMARYNDRGPYSVDNVHIVKVRENLSEGNQSSSARKTNYSNPAVKSKKIAAMNNPSIKKKLSDSQKIAQNSPSTLSKRYKPINTPDGVFPSRQSAASHYKVDPSVISERMAKQPTRYFYL